MSHRGVCDYLLAQPLSVLELQGVCGAAAISAACLRPKRCCSLEAVYWLRANRVLPCSWQKHQPWQSPELAFVPKAVLQHGMQHVHHVCIY